MPDEPDLQSELMAAGIEIDHHESDLYFQGNSVSMSILEKYPLHKKNASPFLCNITNTLWMDVPFAYTQRRKP